MATATAHFDKIALTPLCPWWKVRVTSPAIDEPWDYIAPLSQDIRVDNDGTVVSVLWCYLGKDETPTVDVIERYGAEVNSPAAAAGE